MDMIDLHINIHTLKPCHLARTFYTELFINERTNFWLMNDHCFNITSLQGCGTHCNCHDPTQNRLASSRASLRGEIEFASMIRNVRVMKRRTTAGG